MRDLREESSGMNTDHIATEAPPFYDEPLIYDVLYGPGTATEVDLLTRIEREHSRSLTPRPRRVWLEPACGSGRYLRVLASRGQPCIGFDRNRAMLAYAQERLGPQQKRRCRLLHADLRRFADAVGDDAADFAFIPVNTLRHLMTGPSVARHFREMARVLRPGGIYVVGISLSCYGEEEVIEDRWEGRRGALHVEQTISYIPPEAALRREQVISHLRIRRPRGGEYRDCSYWLRSYDESQWKSLVRRSPFDRVASLDDEGRAVGESLLDYQLEVLRLPR